MVDDLTLVRLGGDHFWVFPTPSRVDIVTAWLTEHAKGRHAYVTNMASGTAYLSIQGPRSRETLAKLTDLDLSTAAAALLPRRPRRRGRGAGPREPDRLLR